MEVTEYFIVRREPIEIIKKKLEERSITAAIDDYIDSQSNYDWVAIYAPLITGFRIPNDFSTFQVLVDPWNNLIDVFLTIIKIRVEENGLGWVLLCSHNRVYKELSFSENTFFNIEFRPDEKTLLANVFGIPFEVLDSWFRGGQTKPHEFCEFIKAPYLELMYQDSLLNAIPRGTTIFCSELDD